MHEPFEHLLVARLRDRLDGQLCLLLGLRFRHVVATDLQSWLQDGFGHFGYVEAEQMTNLLRDRVVRQRGLVGVALLLELHVTEQQDRADHTEDGGEIFVRQAHDLHGLHGVAKLDRIVDARHRHVAVRKECVVLHVLQQELFDLVRLRAVQQLVEDMKASFVNRLTNGSRFLQKICGRGGRTSLGFKQQ